MPAALALPPLEAGPPAVPEPPALALPPLEAPAELLAPPVPIAGPLGSLQAGASVAGRLLLLQQSLTQLSLVANPGSSPLPAHAS